MNTQINEVLTKMRKQLTTESAWGPESQAAPTDVSQGEAGTLGAENFSPANDQVDAYLTDCVDALMDLYDIDESDAFDFVFSVADVAMEEGLLTELPDEEDGDDALSAWLGKAGTIGFKAMVLQAANESASE